MLRTFCAVAGRRVMRAQLHPLHGPRAVAAVACALQRHRFIRHAESSKKDGLTYLLNQHEEVLKQFKECTEVSKHDFSAKKKLAESIIVDLVRHSSIEEQLVYGLLRDRLPQGRTIYDSVRTDHQLARDQMAFLAGLGAEDHEWLPKTMHKLFLVVKEHMKEEERLFEQLRGKMSDMELAKLEDDLKTAEKSAPSRVHTLAPSGEALAKMTHPLTGVLDEMVNRITGKHKPVSQEVENMHQRSTFADQARDAADGFSERSKEVADNIAQKARSTVRSFTGDASFADQARDAADNFADKAKDFASTAASKARRAADSITGQTSFVDQARDAADNIADKAKDTASSLASKARRKANQITGDASFADQARDVADGFADKAKDVASMAADKGREAWDKGKQVIRNAADQVTDETESLGDRVDQATSKLKEKIQNMDIGDSIRTPHVRSTVPNEQYLRDGMETAAALADTDTDRYAAAKDQKPGVNITEADRRSMEEYHRNIRDDDRRRGVLADDEYEDKFAHSYRPGDKPKDDRLPSANAPTTSLFEGASDALKRSRVTSHTVAHDAQDATESSLPPLGKQGDLDDAQMSVADSARESAERAQEGAGIPSAWQQHHPSTKGRKTGTGPNRQ